MLVVGGWIGLSVVEELRGLSRGKNRRVLVRGR